MVSRLLEVNPALATLKASQETEERADRQDRMFNPIKIQYIAYRISCHVQLKYEVRSIPNVVMAMHLSGKQKN